MRALWLAAFGSLLLTSGIAAAQSKTPPRAERVVLIEESGADGARWTTVMPLLKDAGLQIMEAPIPSNAEAISAAGVRKVLASVDGPVVLVAHGLGGGVASEVGTDPGVSALVFIAATAPEAGEDLAPLFARFLVGASQPPGAAAPPIEGKSGMAGWREKPGFYAVFTQSEALSPELQRFFAARMNAKTIVLDDAPSAMESHAREIAGLILEAAGQKPPACGAAGDGRKGACAAPALPRSLMKGCKCTKGSLEDLTKP